LLLNPLNNCGYLSIIPFRLDELINKLDIALKKYRDLVEDAPEGASGEQLNEWR
jgi:hypothetical protein